MPFLELKRKRLRDIRIPGNKVWKEIRTRKKSKMIKTSGAETKND